MGSVSCVTVVSNGIPVAPTRMWMANRLNGIEGKMATSARPLEPSQQFTKLAMSLLWTKEQKLFVRDIGDELG
jgi:hypothetical protein